METKTGERRFLAQASITRNGETFIAKAYPPPPDTEGRPRYVVEDLKGNPIRLEPEEKTTFDILIFGKPEPEDVFRANQLKKAVKRSSTRKQP